MRPMPFEPTYQRVEPLTEVPTLEVELFVWLYDHPGITDIVVAKGVHFALHTANVLWLPDRKEQTHSVFSGPHGPVNVHIKDNRGRKPAGDK